MIPRSFAELRGKRDRRLFWPVGGLAGELRGKFGKRHGNALYVIQPHERRLVARRLLRQNRPMPVRRPLHDLLREGALDLRREAAPKEEEASALADILHGFGDRRL